MTARALTIRIPLATLRRGVLAGVAWGLVMGIGLPLLTFFNCGTICLSDVAITTAVSIVAGLATMGPLAVLDAREPDEGRS